MAATAEAARSAGPARDATYDGFISYSHAADDLLAPRLQAGLQRFAKPWWKRRALRVFRDESSLSANPHLWSSITEALDGSEWFVLLLSEEAAQSEWVNREVEYWLEHKRADRVLPVVTDGEFSWVDGDVAGSAAPGALSGAFSEEPRWVDLRWARTDVHLDLNNPKFSDAVADIASAIRGVPKDELASEEVRQHRRTVRTAWAAGVIVLLLAIAATVGAIVAVNESNEAEDQRDEAQRQAEIAEENAEEAQRQESEAERQAEIAAENEQRANDEAERATRLAEAEAEARAVSEARELAAAAIATLERDPELATLLALEAMNRAPDTDEPPVELINAIWQAGSSNRLVGEIDTGYGSLISLSKDGERLAATVASNVLRMYETASGDAVWDYAEDTADFFAFPVIGPDGRVALPVFDSAADFGPEPAGEPDELPNRVVVLSADGTRETNLEFPGCLTAGNVNWSPDGGYLAVSGADGCRGDDAPQWIEVFDTATWETAAFLPIEGRGDLAPSPRFDGFGKLYGLRGFEEAVVFDTETFEFLGRLPASGIGDITPDGSRLLTYYSIQGVAGEAGSPFSVLVFDAESGDLADILYTGIRYPTVPFGATATTDGKYIIVATQGATTHIYEPTTGRELFRLPTGVVNTVGYDSSLELLYTSAMASEGVQIWDLGASSVGVETTGDLGAFSWVNGNSFRVGPELGAVMVGELATGRWATGIFNPDTGNLLEMVPDSAPTAALANGKFLLEMISDASLASAIYDPATGELNRFFECPNFDPRGGCLDPGFALIVSADGDELLAFPLTDQNEPAGEVHTLDLNTGQIVTTDPIDEDQLFIEAFTDTWILGSPTDRIDFSAVDRSTGAVLWEDERGDIRFELSSNGRGLVTYGSGGSVQLIDTETWESLVVGGFTNVRGVSFNGDTTLIAVADTEALRVIDIESGRLAQQVQLPGVSDIHWIDDETLVVGTNTGIFGTLSISTNDLIDRTRANLRRTFTDQECITYRIDPCPSLEEIRSRG